MVDDRWKLCSCFVAFVMAEEYATKRVLNVLWDYAELLERRGYGSSRALMAELMQPAHVYDGVYKLLTWWDAAGLKEGDATHIFEKHQVSFGTDEDQEPAGNCANSTNLIPNILS